MIWGLRNFIAYCDDISAIPAEHSNRDHSLWKRRIENE